MKNRKNIHKAWKVGLLGVTACFVLGGCNVSKVTDEEQSGNNAVIATSMANEEAVDFAGTENSTNTEKTDDSRDAEKADDSTDAEKAEADNTQNVASEVSKTETEKTEKSVASESTGSTEKAAATNTKESDVASYNVSTVSSKTTTENTVTEQVDEIAGGVESKFNTAYSQNSPVPMISMERADNHVYKGNTPDYRMILMDIQYPWVHDYSENTGTALHKVYDQVNTKCAEEAKRYQSEYETLARDEYNGKTDWEDGSYYYSSKGYFRRVDEKVFSMVEFIESYAHGAHPCYNYIAHNYDVATGKEITLNNLTSDKEALYNAIKIALTEKYDASVFLEEDTLTTTLHDYVCGASSEELVYSIEKDGVSFWFGNYELSAFSEGCQMVTIPFKGNDGLFNKEYVTAEEDSVKMAVPGVSYKLASGHTLEIIDGSDQYGYVDLQIVFDKKVTKIENFCGYDTQKTYLVHKSGKDYLYCQANGYSDDDCMVIYSLNEDQLGSAKYTKDGVALTYAMIDTQNIDMYTRIDVLCTMLPEKMYRVGEDGMPVSDEAFSYVYQHELTLLQDLKIEVAANENADMFTEEVLPAGTKLALFRTNTKDIMDLKLQDGRIARLKLDLRNYSFEINGISEDQLFEGMIYCD